MEDDNYKIFIEELEILCKKYGLAIAWDEHNEEFCVEKISGKNLEFLLSARDHA